MTRLDEIKKRCANATPGPWFPGDAQWLMNVNTHGDAQFIAHSREDIPYLLSELETANQIVYECERTNEKCCKKIIRLEAKLERAQRLCNGYKIAFEASKTRFLAYHNALLNIDDWIFCDECKARSFDGDACWNPDCAQSYFA